MIRAGIPSVLAVLLLAIPCAAQEWAEKMFTVRSYDFGNVARGAKAEFAFELTNLYLEDVHIASVTGQPREAGYPRAGRRADSSRGTASEDS
ncbi:MAG: hypothetical protein ACLQNE_26090 [Thermoguttaceae bacterium]